MHVSVRDVYWATAIQEAIRSRLRAFCVSNHQDERALKTLCGQHGCDVPKLIVQQFRTTHYDVQLPDRDHFHCLYDEIQIDVRQAYL